MEKEKDLLSQELNDGKAKLLKFVEEKGQREKERYFFKDEIHVLNENKIINFGKRKRRGRKEKTCGNRSSKCINKYINYSSSSVSS